MPPFTTWAQTVHPFHFIGLVFLALMAYQYVMSLVNPLPQPWEHRRTGSVDLTPWKWAKPVGFGIIAIVVALYIVFADFSVIG